VIQISTIVAILPVVAVHFYIQEFKPTVIQSLRYSVHDYNENQQVRLEETRSVREIDMHTPLLRTRKIE